MVAILEARNPDKLLMLHELLGLNEDDTLQFLLLVGLVRRGNESKSLTVLEAEWKSLAKDGEFQFFEKTYYIRTSRKTKAYFISVGGIQQKGYHVTNAQFEVSAVLNYQDAFHKEVKGILAQNQQTTSPASSNSNSQEKCCTTRKALMERPLGISQQEKRQNNNPTPTKFKPNRNHPTICGTYGSNLFPCDKENNPIEEFDIHQSSNPDYDSHNLHITSFVYPNQTQDFLNSQYSSATHALNRFGYSKQPDYLQPTYCQQSSYCQMDYSFTGAPATTALEYFACAPSAVDFCAQSSSNADLQSRSRGETKELIEKSLCQMLPIAPASHLTLLPALQPFFYIPQKNTTNAISNGAATSYENKSTITVNDTKPHESLKDERTRSAVFAVTEEKNALLIPEDDYNDLDECWAWGPPPSEAVSVDNANPSAHYHRSDNINHLPVVRIISASSSIKNAIPTGSTAGISTSNADGAACALSWSDAKSLKLALNERTLKDPSAGLCQEELKIAQLLTSKMTVTDGTGIQKLVFPKSRGQNESLTFYRKPTTGARGGGKKSSKTASKIILCLIEELCNECNISATSLLQSLVERSREKEEGKRKKILIEQSLTLMKLAGLSENAYHQIRVFTKDIMKIEWGASLSSIKRYLRVAIPSDEVFSTVESLQVGSTESSNQRKFKNCNVWKHKYPLHILAIRLKYLYNKGMFQPSSEFSNLEDNTILTVSNVDKADKFTSCMVRILNEKNGNSGNSTVILGVIGGNANESYENLSKSFLSDQSPIRSALQMLLDDSLVAMHVTLRNPNGEISQECCILHCLVAEDFCRFPSHIRVVDTSDEIFLKSSTECLTIEKMDDFSNFCLLRQKASKCLIAAALLNSSGDPIVWFQIGDDSDRLSDAEIAAIHWKRIRGWEGSDNKMCAILAGHQGASSKFSCYCCIDTKEEMRDAKRESIMRTGDRSNLTLFQRYHTYKGSTGPKDDNARRDECFNITAHPILNVPLEKQMFAPSHTTTGNMAHIDSLLIKALEDIEKKSQFYTHAQSLKIDLSKHQVELLSELKIRKRDMKKRRVELEKFERNFGNISAGINLGYSRQKNELELTLLQTDSQLKDLLEYTSIVKEGLENLQQYLDGKSDSLSVTCLNQCYLNVAKVSLGRYQGGRNFLFRDARSVATKFDLITKGYLFLIEKLNADHNFSFDLKAIASELSKAAACVFYLGPICTMAESQTKVRQWK